MTSPPNEPKKVPLRVRLPFTTQQEFVERYGANVTRGGIFIATRSGKPEGTPLTFELVLQDGARLMRGEGVVHKLVVDEQPGKAGMLVRFTRIDAATRALIDQIVERQPGVLLKQVAEPGCFELLAGGVFRFGHAIAEDGQEMPRGKSGPTIRGGP